MNPTKTTGQAAHLVHSTEPRLSNLVRRGKIHPEPEIVAGRRLWTEAQVRQAAERLGTLTPEIDRAVAAAFAVEEVARG